MKKQVNDPRLIQLRDYIESGRIRKEVVARKIGVTARTIAYWMDDASCRVSPLASGPLDRFLAGISK
jgi:hypothetical protein